jgi:hypothetical protein
VSRPAHEIIDNAVAENRNNEYILYAFMIVSFCIGLIVIGWALIGGHPIATLGGAIESLLTVPAITNIRAIRRENMRLRLLEVPLASTNSPDEACAIILKIFPQDSGLAKGSRKKLKGGK